MFFTHYEPRVRDNERRAQAGRPFRRGPAVPGPADGPAPVEAPDQAGRGEYLVILMADLVT